MKAIEAASADLETYGRQFVRQPTKKPKPMKTAGTFGTSNRGKV